MIKQLLTTMVFLIGFSTLTGGLHPGFYHKRTEWEKAFDATSLHFSYGNAYLLSHKPLQALEHFQRAGSFLDKINFPVCSFRFLIPFSQVIAYDCLGLHDQCKQAVSALFLTLNQYYDEREELSFENVPDTFLTLNQDDEDEDEDEEDESFEDDEVFKIVMRSLQNLVSLAPSVEIRELLLSKIDEVAEELSIGFLFFDPQFVEDALSYNYTFDDYSIDVCKEKFIWKMFKKGSSASSQP